MIALLICLAWLFLLLFWGGFWRADQRLGAAATRQNWPDVSILIPARNEAETISDAVHAHMATSYPGKVTLIVTDDHSTDGTGEIAKSAGANVVTAKDLPNGWSGKLWALQNALQHADQITPDAAYILLTDADILHDPNTLSKLVAKAEAEGLDLVSLMARLDARSFWGALLIPAFIFFFQKLYPFAWVNRPGSPVAAAAGGCVLVRRKALHRIGDFPALHDALIDDCTLAARIKQSGGKLWLGLADDEVLSLRDNRSFASIWAMVRRTAFTQLRHSWVLLGLSVLGMLFLYIGPVLALTYGLLTLSPEPTMFGALACVLMSVAYWPTLRLYRQSRWKVLTLPLAAAFYTAMTVASAVAHMRGAGGAWKGRTYA